MKKLKIIIISTFLTMVSVSLFSQQQSHAWRDSTEGNYSYSYVTNDPAKARFYTLKNGLTVILSPSTKVPRIQTLIATKAGSKTDPENFTGLAHYLEHMLFKGTDRYGSKDWAAEKPLLDTITSLYARYNATKDEAQRKVIYKHIDSISGLAATFAIANEYDKMMSGMGAKGTNAFTSFEQTVYTEDIPTNVIDKYLAVQAERFRNPVFRLFHTELETVYEEKNKGLDNDYSKSFEALFLALFPQNNYGKQTVIGTIEHLKNPSIKAIDAYYKQYYVPNNMAVIMSGDFDPASTIAKIDAAFAFMQPKALPEYTFEPETPILEPIVREVKGPASEFLYLAFRFPGAATKEAQQLKLLATMLSNGSAGLIDLNLVKPQKLLSAGSFAYTLKDYSVLVLQGLPTQGQSLEQVSALLLAELEKLRKGDFSEDLVLSITNNEKRNEIQRNEEYTSRAYRLLDNFVDDMDWAKQLSYTDQIASISKQEIIDFANSYLKPENYVLLYKRQGVDEKLMKVDKPAITAVPINREDNSAFLKDIDVMPEASIAPQWVDYDQDIQKEKLQQMDVLAVQNKTNELFTLIYNFKLGNRNNKVLPLAVDFLPFLGTATASNADISTELYKLASRYNVSSQGEETYVTISGLNSNFPRTLAIFQDLLKNCVVDQTAFEAYIGRVQKERSDAKNSKSTILSGLLSYAKYGEHNPFNNTLTDSELSALKVTDLVQALHELAEMEHTILYYGPQNTQALLQSLPPLNEAGKPLRVIPEAQKFPESVILENKVLFAHYDMKQAEINWIRNDQGYDPAQEPVIALFNTYFGLDMSSLVFQTIRESKALAYSTYAYVQKPYKKENLHTFYANVGTQADKFKEAARSMTELLNDLPESEKTFNIAKTSLTKSLASNRTTDVGLLYNYLSAARLGNKIDVRKTIFEEVNKLTFADVRQYHDKVLRNKAFVYAVIAHEDNLTEEDLKSLGTLQKLSLTEIFGY